MTNEKILTLIVVQPVGINRMLGTRTVMAVVQPEVREHKFAKLQNGNFLAIDTRDGASKCITHFYVGGDTTNVRLTGKMEKSELDDGILGRVNLTVLRATQAEIDERIKKTPNRKVLED